MPIQMTSLNGRIMLRSSRPERGRPRSLRSPTVRHRTLLEHAQAARVVGVRLRVQEHFDVLEVETELRDALHDHRRCAGITTVEHDMGLGPGEEGGWFLFWIHQNHAPAEAAEFASPLTNLR